jgi:hypothetical protein
MRGTSAAAIILVREMDKVKGAIAQRDHLIVHDHANRASVQPALHLRNVGNGFAPAQAGFCPTRPLSG